MSTQLHEPVGASGSVVALFRFNRFFKVPLEYHSQPEISQNCNKNTSAFSMKNVGGVYGFKGLEL